MDILFYLMYAERKSLKHFSQNQYIKIKCMIKKSPSIENLIFNWKSHQARSERVSE